MTQLPVFAQFFLEENVCAENRVKKQFLMVARRSITAECDSSDDNQSRGRLLNNAQKNDAL